MAKVVSWACRNVHVAAVVAVTVDRGSGELRSRRLSGQTVKVVASCAGLPAPVKVAYEAGPTWFVDDHRLLDDGVYAQEVVRFERRGGSGPPCTRHDHRQQRHEAQSAISPGAARWRIRIPGLPVFMTPVRAATVHSSVARVPP